MSNRLMDQLDTNLLRVLYTLLTERSVTRTALKLGQSQPAISNMLKRLREITGDAILVRGRNGMTPTDRGQELLQLAQQALKLMESIASPAPEFVPAHTQRVFHLGAPDYLSVQLLPLVIGKIREVAPQAGLVIHALNAGFDYAAALENGELMQRQVLLSSGAVTLSQAASPQELHIDDLSLINTFGPEYRMLLIGAGQLSEYLATMARFNGFAVTVCDPRPEYSGAWSVPHVTITREMPDDVVQSFRPDRRSCVVALTHDPKLDDLALIEALETPAFYVGAIGSRRNNDARRARMIEHFGQTEQSLQRLRGPIGIYIGSKMPSEIAVSIMAEILAVKNNVALPREMDVAQAKNDLDVAHNDPGALVCAPRRS